MEAMETIGCARKGTATWQVPCVAVLDGHCCGSARIKLASQHPVKELQHMVTSCRSCYLYHRCEGACIPFFRRHVNALYIPLPIFQRRMGGLAPRTKVFSWDKENPKWDWTLDVVKTVWELHFKVFQCLGGWDTFENRKSICSKGSFPSPSSCMLDV